MEKSKQGQGNLNNYWKIFLPFVFFLLISVPFPLRILGGWQTFGFYGVLFLIVLRTAYRLYQQYHWQYRPLLLLLGLCVALAAWQLIDMLVNRGGSTGGFGDWMAAESSVPDYIGNFWREPLFKDETIQCHTIHEQYFGNEFIAIRFTAQHESWPICGG